MSGGGTRSPVAVALVHYPVRDRHRGTGSTTVTPLNVHDIARCAATYGVSTFYVVTPIHSQQALVERILRHWREGHGGVQNPSRRESLRVVAVVSSVNEAAEDLFRRTGSYPLVVGTGARKREGSRSSADLREEIARSERPRLILFGTGWGLAPEILEQCDEHLAPLRGEGDYNHLSVRAAAAIILDRLLGK